MTETSSLPPTPSSTSWPALVRRRDDRVLAGVCAAAGRATGTDPVLWRVLLAVLAVFGGTGLLLYAAGWLLIPEEGEPESIGERTLRTRGGNLGQPATVALVVIAAVALAAYVGNGQGLVPLLVIGVVGYLVFLSGRAPPRRPSTPVPTVGPDDPARPAPPRPRPGGQARPEPRTYGAGPVV